MLQARRWWLTGAIAAFTALAVATPGSGPAPQPAAARGLDAYGVPHVYPAGTNPEGAEHERLATAPESVDNVDAVGAALAQDRQARQLPTVDGNRRWVSAAGSRTLTCPPCGCATRPEGSTPPPEAASRP